MSSADIKIYLIAGEPSGDLLGSRLMRALREKTQGHIHFYGLGGDTMETEGLKSLFDISELSVMGIAEVIPSIPKILKRIRQTVDNIKEINPDIVITIDSWSFSARVHKALRKSGLKITQLHYVAPQVWAWKKKRAKTMYKYIDRLLTLLPQEPKYFIPYHLKTDFVGHPVIESNVVHGDSEQFRLAHKIPQDKRIITILPGSRHTEVSRLLPVYLEAASQLLHKHPDLFFVLPTVKTVSSRVKEMVKDTKLPLILVETEKERYDAFKASSAAIAASGTVALELAICNIPHIIGYIVSPLTAFLAQKLLKIQFVNLSNILLGREIIPELLQERCKAGNICQYIEHLLNKDDLYEKQMKGFQKVREILGCGIQTPSQNAADIVLEMITSKNK